TRKVVSRVVEEITDSGISIVRDVGSFFALTRAASIQRCCGPVDNKPPSASSPGNVSSPSTVMNSPGTSVFRQDIVIVCLGLRRKAPLDEDSLLAGFRKTLTSAGAVGATGSGFATTGSPHLFCSSGFEKQSL